MEMTFTLNGKSLMRCCLPLAFLITMFAGTVQAGTTSHFEMDNNAFDSFLTLSVDDSTPPAITDNDGDGVAIEIDDDDNNPYDCYDSDGDGCDDCSVTGSFGYPDPNDDGFDYDGDGICDSGDNCPYDFDNDSDGDGWCANDDNCDFGYNPDQLDYDGDGDGDACDFDDDGDTVDDELDMNPLDQFSCEDMDGDLCDDCTYYGSPHPEDDGVDHDGDGLCDAGDPDIDGDLVLNEDDIDDYNIYACEDSDGDGCDDCYWGYGYPAPYEDGDDYDYDGLCDLGDDDIDNDGILNDDDINDYDEFSCEDSDGDGCDDCFWVGYADPYDDGSDYDGDGLCDDGDNDADDDGVEYFTDVDDYNEFVCEDSDGDGCDDCSVGGYADPTNDGDDYDLDGICDGGDNCSETYNPEQTNSDTDALGDACDNCPLDDNSGQEDFDSDGEGDACDQDDDNDMVNDVMDPAPQNAWVCGDSDDDGCDDCSVQGFQDAGNDGEDTDIDGICNNGDNCPFTYNPDQEDENMNDIGDACEGCVDADVDLICDDVDNCLGVENNDQTDNDSDGLGNACDNCPNSSSDPDQTDTDADGIGDLCDNCIDVSNEDQTDLDSDDIGDACDDCTNAAPGIEHFNYTSCHCETGYFEVYDESGYDFDRAPQIVIGCTPCPPGFYCPDGIASYPCPADTYADQFGSTVCTPCAEGYSSEEGAVVCTSESTCDDGVMNGNELGIDCGGPDCDPCPAPEAVCGILTVYVTQGAPAYNGPGNNDIWLVPASSLDAGSTSSDPAPVIQVKRYLSDITFDWTLNGACVDLGPAAPFNTADKGTVYRNCLPVTPGNINVNKMYKLKITDDFGSDECTGTVKVKYNTPAHATPSVHFVIPNTGEFLSIDKSFNVDENVAAPQSVIAEDFRLVPNPGNDMLKVYWSAATPSPVEIMVTDLTGKLVFAQPYESLRGENMVMFDMSRYGPGMYTVVLKSEKDVKATLWVKE